MNSKRLIFLLILLLDFGFLFPANSQLIKLEKVAVSQLPEGLVVPDLKSVTPDHNGNVFAFAGKTGGRDCFVIKFDENLKYLKRFGSDGKGPGEFTTVNLTPERRLSVDTNGDVYVMDHNPCRFVVFDNEGNYKKDIPIDKDYSKFFGKISQIKIVGNGMFAAEQYRWELPPQGLLLTLTPPRVKVRYIFDEKRIRAKHSSFTSRYYGRNCIIDTNSQQVVFGNTQIYKFQVYDGDGNLKLEVYDKDRVMGSFDNKELEYIKSTFLTPNSGLSSPYNDFLAQLNAEKALFRRLADEIKKSKNVIVDIKISGERIYVFTVSDDISIEEKWPVEIYNLKGKVVKKGYFKDIPAKIWRNYAFFYDRDEEEDNPLILKYKILDHNSK